MRKEDETSYACACNLCSSTRISEMKCSEMNRTQVRTRLTANASLRKLLIRPEYNTIYVISISINLDESWVSIAVARRSNATSRSRLSSMCLSTGSNEGQGGTCPRKCRQSYGFTRHITTSGKKEVVNISLCSQRKGDAETTHLRILCTSRLYICPN